MSLSDRLQAAAKVRQDLGRGVPVRHHHRPSGWTRTVDGIEMILSPSRPVKAVEPDPAADPEAICPACGRTGDLGLVDLARRTASWACEACGAMWRAALPPPREGELRPPAD